VAAINGTFFDEQNRPLGWLVSEGRTLNPLRDVGWWSALVVREQGGHASAEILTTAQVQALAPLERNRVTFAVQVGPRTVVGASPVKLKNQVASRSAVCLKSPSVLVFVSTESKPMESNDLATAMSKPESQGGIGCQEGMMFDGGPSSQLAVNAGRLQVDLFGGWDVPNAVVVVPRPSPALATEGDGGK